MAGATGPGFAPSTDAITMEFSRCWGYLGELGMMAKDMIIRMTGENTSMQQITQLSRIVKLVERAAQMELEENQARCRKCNFFNRGFCSQGTSCKFEHPLEVCEQYEEAGICVTKKCRKRHLYSCRYYNSESGCSRGEFCSFSHRTSSGGSVDEKEKKVNKCVVAPNDRTNNLDNKGLGQGQFGWLPRAREPVAADLHVQQVQLVPCQQLQDDVENESEIGSKEAIEERDPFDDLVEAIKKVWCACG